MPSKGVDAFTELDRDVTNLLSLHPAEKGTPGRPKGDTGPLLRSTVVLIATAWETYVEQAVSQAFEHALDAIGEDHTKVLGQVRPAVENAGKKDPWSVSGLGWKTVAAQLVDARVKALNNAGPGQVNGLVYYALGFPDFLSSVSWQGMSATKITKELGELINDTRGDIVHTGKTRTRLGKSAVERWQNFMAQLVTNFDRQLANEVVDRYGSAPWS